MGKDDMIQPCSVTVKDGLLLTSFNKTRFDRGCFFGVKKDGTLVFKCTNTSVYRCYYNNGEIEHVDVVLNGEIADKENLYQLDKEIG